MSNGVGMTIVFFVLTCLGLGIFYFFKKLVIDKKLQLSEQQAERLVEVAKKEQEAAKREQESILKQAKDELMLVKEDIKQAKEEAASILQSARSTIEKEQKEHRRIVSQGENRILQKERHLESKQAEILEKEIAISHKLDEVKGLEIKKTELVERLSTQLETIAGLSKEEAENRLMEAVELDCAKKASALIHQRELQAKKTANKRAREIIVDAIQRTAVDHVQELTTSTVKLPDEDMKGRIIGKEGRNIRSFEAATGVDLIIDDTPNAVVLSSFDPIRREIAKIALTTLLEDGRIHPARIEGVVEKSKKQLDDILMEKGELASEEVGLDFHPKIIELLGKLFYRTSYGQNILMHSLEASHIAGIMAYELGLNVNLAKRGALLHDIGKAIDFERGGSHTELGKEICQKYNESSEVINCIMAHHDEEDPETAEAILVKMADAMSSVRPGARKDSVDTYIKRLEELEKIATSFLGVEKAYAIQAGREVRVLVQPDQVSDDSAHKLALDISKKIERELEYPGEVTVAVIRETRAIGVAK